MAHNCTHFGPTPLGTIGKTQIFGAAGEEMLGEAWRWSLVVALAGASFPPKTPFLEVNEKASALFSGTPGLFAWEPPPRVALEWPDGGIPALSPQWWDAFTVALRHVKGEVVFHCHGGHGRTGTALAVLFGRAGLCLSTKGKKMDPIAWVRDVYCEKAVETQEQIDYVCDLTGWDSKQKPSRTWESTTPAGGAPPSLFTEGGWQNKMYPNVQSPKTPSAVSKNPRAETLGNDWVQDKDGNWCKVASDGTVGKPLSDEDVWDEWERDLGIGRHGGYE